METHHITKIPAFVGRALMLLCSVPLLAIAQDKPAEPAAPAPAAAAPEKPQVVKLDETRYRIGKITVDLKTREIRLPAKMNMEEGLLEFLLVQQQGKVHEALLITDASPTHLNLALILLRYQPSNELFSLLDETGHITGLLPDVPDGVRARARIKIEVEWKDAEGKTQRKPVNEWIQHSEEATAMPPGPWLYTGSDSHEGRYIPEITGDVAAIFEAPEAMINYPGADGGSDLVWHAFSERVPAKDTEVTLIITPFFKEPAKPQATGQVRLSSLDLSRVQQGEGKPGVDASTKGKPLSIAAHPYTHGLGTRATSALHLDLQGGSTRFTAQVGVTDDGPAIKKTGSVEFVIEGDGKVIWCSPLMRGGMPAQAVDLDLSGVKMLALRVNDGFDGTTHDEAAWADATFHVTGAKPVTVAAPTTPPRWVLGKDLTTEWRPSGDPRLPHADFIEQGGLRVGQVVRYRVGAERNLSMRRSVVWPGLRKGKNGMFDGVIQHYDSQAVEPVITLDGAPLGPITVDRVLLDGTLTIEGVAGQDLAITRCAFPSTTLPTAIDRWSLRNTGKKPRTIAVAPLSLRQQVEGPYGLNVTEVSCTAPASTVLAPGKELVFAVLFHGRLDNESAAPVDLAAEEKARRAYVAGLQRDLRLETPDPELDQAFSFCKLRVAEAINATRGGMMLAPGGLAYYAAAWCNDNVEYAGPLFPFLGDPNGNQASLDTYRLFQKHMKPNYETMPPSLCSEGVGIARTGGDRGDAAMYAYGCARFCLARGDKAISEELWPAIAWSLEYCHRKTTPDGVIASDSDELEGRLPTGKANLSTSSLCYGGLRSAADLGRALGKDAEARTYDQRADALAKAIDKYFGAKVEGFDTYRYYDGNDVLRSWICLPLCMGLTERRAGTIAALFSPRLWTADGLASQAGDLAFWDRSTLYGLRGVLQAGETATGMRYLTSYTRRRLLGDHVPYPVEAWPEGDQRHLSSESGLYCRIFTEGLFGLKPTGLDRFRCTPRLPDGWPRMALRSVRAFNRNFDVVVERRGEKQHLTVIQGGKNVAEHDLASGESIEIQLP